VVVLPGLVRAPLGVVAAGTGESSTGRTAGTGESSTGCTVPPTGESSTGVVVLPGLVRAPLGVVVLPDWCKTL